MRYELYYWPENTGTRRICSARLGRRGRGLRGRGAAASRHGGDVALSGKPIGQAATVRPAFFESRQVGHRAHREHSVFPRSSSGPRAQRLRRAGFGRINCSSPSPIGSPRCTIAHHPVASSSYYEEQKREAKRRAENFRAERLPKFLNYFEGVLERNGRSRSGRQRGFVPRSVTLPDDRRPPLRISPRDEKAGAQISPDDRAARPSGGAPPACRLIFHPSGVCRSIRKASFGTIPSWMIRRKRKAGYDR